MGWKKDLLELKFNYLERFTPMAFKQAGGRSMVVKPYGDHCAHEFTRAVFDFFKFNRIKAEITGRTTIKAYLAQHEITVEFGQFPPILSKEQIFTTKQNLSKEIAIKVSNFYSFLHQFKVMQVEIDKRNLLPTKTQN